MYQVGTDRPWLVLPAHWVSIVIQVEYVPALVTGRGEHRQRKRLSLPQLTTNARAILPDQFQTLQNPEGADESCLPLLIGRPREAVAYLQRFDVITLTETRSARNLRQLLPQYAVYTTLARDQGLGGQGLLVAVRRNPAYCAQKWAAADGMLWVMRAPS